jgi:hypothetical protein
MSFLNSAGLFGADIPDAAVALWQTNDQPESDGQTVSDLDDSVGGYTATASGDPTLQAGASNGEDVIRFDGNDYFSVSSTDWDDVTAPYTVILGIVDSAQPTGARERTFYEARSHGLYWDDAGGTGWSMFSDDSNGFITGGSTLPVVLTGIFDSTDATLRENGSVTAGGVGSNTDISDTLSAVGLGAASDGNKPITGDLGVVAGVYDTDLRDTDELESEEQRIANESGITL